MGKNIFAVGLTLSVESHYKTYLPTQVIGWETDAFLITKAIYVDGLPAKLKNKETYKVRFLQEGVAYGFESEIITVQFAPFPLMYMKYPTKVETLKLRVAQRYKTDLPAKLLDAAGKAITEAVLVDISEGGCGLKVPLLPGQELSHESAYAISCSIMDKELILGCVVKKLDKNQTNYFFGLEFTNATALQKERLNQFIEFLSKHTAA